MGSQITEGHSGQMDRQTGHPGGGSQEVRISSLASDCPKAPAPGKGDVPDLG